MPVSSFLLSSLRREARRFREEWYAAVELWGDRRAGPFQTMQSLPMYEEMITSAAWWDVVDGIATSTLGASPSWTECP